MRIGSTFLFSHWSNVEIKCEVDVVWSTLNDHSSTSTSLATLAYVELTFTKRRQSNVDFRWRRPQRISYQNATLKKRRVPDELFPHRFTSSLRFFMFVSEIAKTRWSIIRNQSIPQSISTYPLPGRINKERWWICVGIQHSTLLWQVLSRCEPWLLDVLDSSGWRFNGRIIRGRYLRSGGQKPRSLCSSMGACFQSGKGPFHMDQ